MKSYPFYTIVLSMLFIIVGCNYDNDQMENCDQIENRFAIYLLADSSQTYRDISLTPIENLDLGNYPIITEEDIDYYKIKYFGDNVIPHHSFKLKEELQPFGDRIIPFVVVADSERVYVGEYWPGMLCIMSQSILILKFETSQYSEYHVLPYFQDEIDQRNDERILEALENACVLEVNYENNS